MKYSLLQKTVNFFQRNAFYLEVRIVHRKERKEYEWEIKGKHTLYQNDGHSNCSINI